MKGRQVMNRLRLCIPLLLLSALGWTVGFSVPQGHSVDNMIRNSKFIFRGKLERLHASNLKILAGTRNTSIVRVEEVLYAPSTLNDFTRQAITVQLLNTSSMKVGDQAIFFTNGWLYGESIAVTETGHVSARIGSDQMIKQIADVHRSMEDENLRARIARAAFVIVGKVTEINPLKLEKQKRVGSEHDPDWWQARIELRSVEKGRLPGREVVILFPKSDDELWLDSPKFKPGDEGIWILKRDQQERGFPLVRVPGLTALDSRDFQPVSELDRIRRLTK